MSKKAYYEVRKDFKERDEYRVKPKEANRAYEDWSTLAERIVEQTRGLLARSIDEIPQLTKYHEEHLSVEKGRRDST